MALRDLYNDPASFKYNSKDNKYSKDIRGGGYSGQPWQKAPVPRTMGELNSLTTEALSLDYPIRGGSYEELAARSDFARIDAFLLSYPGGRAFLDKQKGLMFSNPLMESGRSLGDVNTRAYSDGRNLMTQIAEGGTGFHHPNAGATLNDLQFDERKYSYIVSHKTTQQNRLVNLLNIKVNNESPGDLLFSNVASALGINTVNQSELFFYPGGPGSLYGLGNTIIRRAQDAKGNPIITSDAPTFVGSNYDKNLYGSIIQARPAVTIDYETLLGPSKIFSLSQDQTGLTQNDSTTLLQQQGADYIRANQSPTQDVTSNFQYTMGYDKIKSRRQILPGNTTVTDFRKDVINPNSVQKVDYFWADKTTRVRLGSPGARRDRTDYNKPFIQGQDGVNMSDVKKNMSDDEIGPALNTDKDLIKFAFETINNTAVSTSDLTIFRALLTGYSDNHSAEWSGKRYAGRGENFYTYQGHDRQVSFNFKVAAQSKQEMKFIYRKLNYLLSTLYPDYNSAGFMKGNITRLTIGDLFVRTPGILTSLNLSVDDQYAWEIAMNADGRDDKTILQTPQIIDVAVSFKPILETLPKKDSSILIASQEGKAKSFIGFNPSISTPSVSPVVLATTQLPTAPIFNG
jgi:hypothetical protein